MAIIRTQPENILTNQDPGLDLVRQIEDRKVVEELNYNKAKPLPLPNNYTVNQVTTIVNNIIQNNPPTGVDGQIQVNENGQLVGDTGLTYEPTTDTLTTGTIDVGNIIISGVANLGNVNTIVIQGGSPGEVLTSNGTGLVHWATPYPSIAGKSGKFLVTDGINVNWSNIAYSSFATTTDVSNAIGNLINSAPTALDTLGELANALGNSGDFTINVVNQLANKVNTSALALVATSGNFSDLNYKPNLSDYLPSQASNSGKYLTTNGTSASWGTVTIPTDIANLSDTTNLLGGGGASLPLTNGTSNIDIASTDGNVTIVSDGSTWTFDTAGNLTVPTNGYVVGTSTMVKVLDATDNYSYHIVLTRGAGDNDVHIDGDDNLQYNPHEGTLTATRLDATYIVGDLQYSHGYDYANLANVPTINGDTGNITFSDTTMTSTNGDVKIHFSPSASPAVEFNFASNGTLTLPGGIVIQNNEVRNTGELSGEVQITTATTQGDTEKNWTFNHNGTGALIVPEGSSVQSKSNFNITATETGFIKFTNIVDFDTNSTVDDNQISIVNPEASILDLIDPASANYVGGLGSVVRIVYGPFRSAVGTIIEAFADPGTTDPLTGLPRYQGRIDIVNPHNGDLLKEFSIEHSSSWKFGSDGNLTLPSNTSKINYANGTSILSGLGAGGGGIALTDISVGTPNTASGGGNVSYNNSTGVFTYTPPDLTSYLTSVPTTLDNSSVGDMDIMVYDGNIKYTSNVTIDVSSGNLKANLFIGNLTLPAGGDILDSTGNSVLGGGASTGNVTFDDNIVIGTGTQDGYLGLYLAVGPDSVANAQYLQVRGGDNTTHIHLDTGNNEYFDQYFGNDNKFLKLEAGNTGNVLIGTDDYTGNLYRWTFGSDSNLTLPAGGDILDSTGNSVLGPADSIVNGDYSVYLQTNGSLVVPAGNASQTSAGQIFSDNEAGFINLDVQFGSDILGGVRLGTTAASPVDIIADNSPWRFGADGNLTLPNTNQIAKINNTPQVGQGHVFATDSVGATPSWNNTSSVTVNKPLGYTSTTWTMTLNDSTPITVTGIVDNNDGTLTINLGGATTASAVSIWPILLASSDYVAEGNDGGTGIVTDAGTWVFRNDGNLSISGSVIPSTDNAYDLGTPTKKFRHIYTDNGSIYVGNIKLSNDNGNLSVVSVTNVGEQNESNVAVALKTDRLSSTTGGHEVILGIDSNLTVPGNIKTNPAGPHINSAITNIGLDGTSVIVALADSVFDIGDSGQITISGVIGMIQANRTWWYQASSSNQFYLKTNSTLSAEVDGSTWTAYTSGGTAFSGTYNDLSIIVGNKNWAFKNDSSLSFPDSTTQTTAYRNRPQRNLNIEGGTASTVFEIDMTYVDCGGSYLRGILSQDTYDGSEGDYNPTIDKILDGGQS